MMRLAKKTESSIQVTVDIKEIYEVRAGES